MMADEGDKEAVNNNERLREKDSVIRLTTRAQIMSLTGSRIGERNGSGPLFPTPALYTPVGRYCAAFFNTGGLICGKTKPDPFRSDGGLRKSAGCPTAETVWHPSTSARH